MKNLLIIPLLFSTLITALNAEEKTVSIGAIYSLSSWGAKGGQDELDGINLAADEINSKGGILGQKIKLFVEDNKSDIKGTVDSFYRLTKQKGVKILLGPNWAEFSDVVAPLAQQTKVLMLSASGYTENLTKNRDFVFTILPAHKYFTKQFAEHILSRGIKTPTLLSSANSYTESMAKALRQQLEEGGAKVETISINPQTIDYRTIISKLNAENSDAVIAFLIQGGDLAGFLKQAKEQNLNKPLFSSNSVLYEDVVVSAPSLADGVTFFNFKINAKPEFLESFKSKYKKDASDNSARAYDTLYMIKGAIENCGSVEPEVFKKCLKQYPFQGTSDFIKFNQDNTITPTKNLIYLMKGEGGELKTL